MIDGLIIPSKIVCGLIYLHRVCMYKWIYMTDYGVFVDIFNPFFLSFSRIDPHLFILHCIYLSDI